MTIFDMLTVILCSVSMVFFLAGTVGLLRFPDSMCKLHALTKVDNLGLGLLVMGLLFQIDSFYNIIQSIFIWLLVMISGAISCFLIANRVQSKQLEILDD